MNSKNLFETYNIFYDIYQAVRSEHGFDQERIENACKEKLSNNTQIAKNKPFYVLKASDGTEEWYGYVSFSKGGGDGKGCNTTLRQRYTKKWYTHELKPQNHVNIEKVALDTILEEKTLLHLLVERMAWLVSFEKEEIEEIADNASLKMLWYFEYHHEAQFLLTDGTQVFVPKQSKLDLSSLFISSDFVAVIDDVGQYGLIRDRRKKFLDEPDVVCYWERRYYYIHVEERLATNTEV